MVHGAPGDDFEAANCRIARLVEDLTAEDICGHCLAHALVFYGAHMLARALGAAAAAEDLDALAAELRSVGDAHAEASRVVN
jgi:hypothetical protein